MDEWGVGCYEQTASELAPVSDVAVAALALTTGDQLLDVACGTGNAALVADRAGALVTGLDSSPRLLEVARGRVPGASFVLGDAAQLPFDDGRFDAAVSVFGIIFARPAEQAAAEIARVVRPGGRVAITAWPARGPLFGAVTALHQALSRVRPPSGAPPANWSDGEVLESLLSPYGDVEVVEERLTHPSTTPEQIWDRWERLHPIWLGARAELEPVGEWEPLREAAMAALRESVAGDALVNPYLLAVLQRR